MRDPRILLLADWSRPGRCRHCRAPVEWHLTGKGKYLPFDRAPLVLSRHENADTTVRFEMVSPESLHFVSCKNKPARPGRERWATSSR